ncbi:flagellar type III secretion system pore protein FliP [Ectobacillus ponti]|uniref:Flagellar biosynthetic protein FliP n=1 Tax=Ectobacillus ponti TaxID=2961894 RepID=A0AA41X9J8_9BACI|nr:flagellar type III secretion system pore protein FliP [Ectobacillus ponti]MCP8968865.1 flagellar type III secretion system pore protein FliP [Ectobacillus ponti]
MKKQHIALFAVLFAFFVSFAFMPHAYAAAKETKALFDLSGKGSMNESVQLFLMVTLLSLSSSIVLMFTQFTYFVIVLGMTRQGLGVTNLPPNQVLVGLALFLALFTMQPVISDLKTDVWDPMQAGKLQATDIVERSAPILKEYMAKHTYEHDLKMMLKVRDEEVPNKPEKVSMLTMVPAFTLTQIQKGILTGMFIYLAFVFIDLIVSTFLMYLGMMMLPPMVISLPFKILIFVYIGGYTKIVDIMFKTVS